MDLTTLLPKEYGYVLLTAALSTGIAQWHSFSVGKYRRVAKVPYPSAYASAEEAKASKEKHVFNCAQRAHANFLEHWGIMLVGMGVAGVSYPLIASGMGAAWCVFRVMYAVGYTNPDMENGKGRYHGIYFWLPELGLQGLATFTGVKMLMGW